MNVGELPIRKSRRRAACFPIRAAAAQEPLHTSFKTPRPPRHSRSPPVSASPVPCQIIGDKDGTCRAM